MKEDGNILTIYSEYISEITAKRLNVLMPLSVVLLTLLIFSDLYIRDSIPAVVSRIFPLLLSVFLYAYNIISPKPAGLKNILYNILLASIPAMMFAKYLIHYNTDTNYVNIIGIITAIFIISLEVRANLLYTILIYAVPPVVFVIILLVFFPVSTEELQSLINIILILIAGFFVNRVQNNFRFKAFKSSYFLQYEKEKLERLNTELKKYKEQLEDMVEKKTLTLKYALEKAKESDALKTQFLLNISHELRTPMNAVIGFSNIIAKKNPEFKKEYKIIEQSLLKLLKTIENIILLSKLQSGQAGMEIQSIEINKLNVEIFSLLKEKVKESNKKISVKMSDNTNDAIIYSDIEKIKTIFNQIFDNAVKYTDEGEIKISVNKKSNDEIEFIVKDTGIGIPVAEVPFVFEMFRKFEKSEKLYEGAGTGLSIVKYLTEMLNAKVMIKSEENKGTEIKLVFKTLK